MFSSPRRERELLREDRLSLREEGDVRGDRGRARRGVRCETGLSFTASRGRGCAAAGGQRAHLPAPCQLHEAERCSCVEAAQALNPAQQEVLLYFLNQNLRAGNFSGNMMSDDLQEDNSF